MHLLYFDENKYSKDKPFFIIGGLIIPDNKALEFEKTLSQIQYNFFSRNILTKDTEFHGKDIFHGKSHFAGRKLPERVKIFHDLALFLTENKIPIRMVSIDVHAHRDKYTYPNPEYRLGLQLILERFCEYLELEDDLGVVFGDYEKDEITQSILDFSQFKYDGKTPMYHGVPLGRLLDTIYFTHSHHSRFLQVADILIFMAGRYENGCTLQKWHDRDVEAAWKKIKANTDFQIKHWP